MLSLAHTNGKKVKTLVFNLNKLALKSRFDLLWHLVYKSFNLPNLYAFATITNFCCAVKDTNNKKCLLHLLVQIVKYNMATNEKMLNKYTTWNKIH